MARAPSSSLTASGASAISMRSGACSPRTAARIGTSGQRTWACRSSGRPDDGMGNRAKPFLIGTAVALLLLIGSVAILEQVFRAKFAEQVNQEALRHPPHPFLQVLTASQVPVNSHGFRGEPIELRKPPRTFRIFALGGSTTLGIGNAYEDTYPFKLQSMLRQRYPDINIEVQNAGSAWYTTAHVLINYQLRVRRFEPDLIIVFEAINDLYRSFSPPWWAVGEFKPDYSHYLGPY